MVHNASRTELQIVRYSFPAIKSYHFLLRFFRLGSGEKHVPYVDLLNVAVLVLIQTETGVLDGVVS